VTLVQRKLVLVCLEIVLNLREDRCTVCAKCSMEWQSFWAQPMDLLVDVVEMKGHFAPFRDSVNLRCMIGAQFVPNIP
jgi:hypothetical protein